ncbi:subclass B3 metallo-beta-lactamase [Lysobacter oculi]|uniref:Subclass B3 metallo-beta-lactamase n=1 Tax=Solilutibacter oculi TaxID=2698682 RepID=A0A344J4H0_9GAMM|nr:subclass B3 metallo-beta-lactamase [Lysobacter oculi]AXA83930.1 subclass B3 metallo-beta-lactamase [Lysobacter oculi]
MAMRGAASCLLAALALTGAACAGPPLQPAQAASQAPLPTACAEGAGWSAPTAPRHVFGNTWFVGTCEIAAVLVTSPQGHVLIDAATDEAAPHIEAGIRAAGFKVEDIRLILNTHEHLDHAGGISRLQRDSGAEVLARGVAAEVLAKGRSDRRDPQFEVLDPFPPVARVRTVGDGEVVKLGDLAITNLPMPGHTPGGSGWAWRSCEGTDCRDIVFSDSLTAISDDHYRYGDHPEMVAAMRRTFDTLAAQRCDILITTHTQSSDLLDRLDGRQSLVDASACRTYAAQGREGLAARLAKERTRSTP